MKHLLNNDACSSRYEKRRLLLVGGIVTLAMLVVALSLTIFISSTAAHAGTNGQQLLVTTSGHSVLVEGQNQNGSYLEHCFQTTPGTNHLANWWWKEMIDVSAYDSNGCNGNLLASTETYVPISQKGDWWAVNVS